MPLTIDQVKTPEDEYTFLLENGIDPTQYNLGLFPQHRTPTGTAAYAFETAAARSALPTTAGVLAGASLLGPVGIVGSIIGGLGTAIGAGFLQERVQRAFETPTETQRRHENIQAIAEQHPAATFSGEVLPSFAFFRPSVNSLKGMGRFVNSKFATGGLATADPAAKIAMMDAAFNVSIGAGVSIASDIVSGREISGKRAIAESLVNALAPAPTRLTRQRQIGYVGRDGTAKEFTYGFPDIPGIERPDSNQTFSTSTEDMIRWNRSNLSIGKNIQQDKKIAPVNRQLPESTLEGEKQKQNSLLNQININRFQQSKEDFLNASANALLRFSRKGEQFNVILDDILFTPLDGETRSLFDDLLDLASVSPDKRRKKLTTMLNKLEMEHAKLLDQEVKFEEIYGPIKSAVAETELRQKQRVKARKNATKAEKAERERIREELIAQYRFVDNVVRVPRDGKDYVVKRVKPVYARYNDFRNYSVAELQKIDPQAAVTIKKKYGVTIDELVRFVQGASIRRQKGRVLSDRLSKSKVRKVWNRIVKDDSVVTALLKAAERADIDVSSLLIDVHAWKKLNPEALRKLWLIELDRVAIMRKASGKVFRSGFPWGRETLNTLTYKLKNNLRLEAGDEAILKDLHTWFTSRNADVFNAQLHNSFLDIIGQRGGKRAVKDHLDNMRNWVLSEREFTVNDLIVKNPAEFTENELKFVLDTVARYEKNKRGFLSAQSFDDADFTPIGKEVEELWRRAEGASPVGTIKIPKSFADLLVRHNVNLRFFNRTFLDGKAVSAFSDPAEREIAVGLAHMQKDSIPHEIVHQMIEDNILFRGKNVRNKTLKILRDLGYQNDGPYSPSFNLAVERLATKTGEKLYARLHDPKMKVFAKDLRRSLGKRILGETNEDVYAERLARAVTVDAAKPRKFGRQDMRELIAANREVFAQNLPPNIVRHIEQFGEADVYTGPPDPNVEVMSLGDVSKFLNINVVEPLPHLIDTINRDGFTRPIYMSYNPKNQEIHFDYHSLALINAARKLQLAEVPVKIKYGIDNTTQDRNSDLATYVGVPLGKPIPNTKPFLRPSELGFATRDLVTYDKMIEQMGVRRLPLGEGALVDVVLPDNRYVPNVDRLAESNFPEYYKNGIFRDDNGLPMVFYHGTFAFDPSVERILTWRERRAKGWLDGTYHDFTGFHIAVDPRMTDDFTLRSKTRAKDEHIEFILNNIDHPIARQLRNATALPFPRGGFSYTREELNEFNELIKKLYPYNSTQYHFNPLIGTIAYQGGKTIPVFYAGERVLDLRKFMTDSVSISDSGHVNTAVILEAIKSDIPIRDTIVNVVREFYNQNVISKKERDAYLTYLKISFRKDLGDITPMFDESIGDTSNQLLSSYSSISILDEVDEAFQKAGYDTIMYRNLHLPENLSSVDDTALIALKPELLKSAVSNNGGYDIRTRQLYAQELEPNLRSKDPNFPVVEHDADELAPLLDNDALRFDQRNTYSTTEARWWHSLPFAGVVEKMARHGRSGMYLRDRGKEFFRFQRMLDGWFVNKALLDLEDIATFNIVKGGLKKSGLISEGPLSREEWERIARYRHERYHSPDRKSNIKLSDREKDAVDRLQRAFNTVAVVAHREGIPVTGAQGTQARGLDPVYDGDVLDTTVVSQLTNLDIQDPIRKQLFNDMLDWMAYKKWTGNGKLKEEHWAAWQKYQAGEKLSEAEEIYAKNLRSVGVDAINKAIQGFSSNSTYVNFGPLHIVEGIGLPWSWREKDPRMQLRRFGHRAAKDISFKKAFRDDPRVVRILGNLDPTTRAHFEHERKELPEAKALLWPDQKPVMPMPPNTDVKAFVEEVVGIMAAPDAAVMAANRLVVSSFLGPISGMRDFFSSNLHALPYITPLINKEGFEVATKFWKEGWVGSFSHGINDVRLNKWAFNPEDANEVVPKIGIIDTLATKLNLTADLISVFQGRNILEQISRYGNQMTGIAAGASALGRLKVNPTDELALEFMNRFAVGVDWRKEVAKNGFDYNPVVLNEIGAQFTERVQGTYDARDLPRLATRGMLAPFLALSRWGINKANVVSQDVLDPALLWFKGDNRGSITPLLTYTLGGVVGGIGIQYLANWMNGQKSSTPTFAEAFGSGQAGYEDYLYAVMQVLHQGGYAGLFGDIARIGTSVTSGADPYGFSFPLGSYISENILTHMRHAMSAIRNGDNPIMTTTRAIGASLRDSVQAYRMIANHANAPKVERKNMFRDFLVWKKLNDLPYSKEFITVNEFLDYDDKLFKRTDDLQKAHELLPKIIDKKIRQAKNSDGSTDYERLRSSLRSLKQNQFTVAPNRETNPQQFNSYIEFIRKTQGEEAATELIRTMVAQQTINQYKSSLVPEL